MGEKTPDGPQMLMPFCMQSSRAPSQCPGLCPTPTPVLSLCIFLNVNSGTFFLDWQTPSQPFCTGAWSLSKTFQTILLARARKDHGWSSLFLSFLNGRGTILSRIDLFYLLWFLPCWTLSTTWTESLSFKRTLREEEEEL